MRKEISIVLAGSQPKAIIEASAADAAAAVSPEAIVTEGTSATQ